MLERKPSLTDQAKAHIKQRILDGEFEDDRIPSESELAAELGVSRTTIRDALSRLQNEGAIYRKQGSGTYVNRAGLQIKTRLEEMWSYESVLTAHGYTPSVRILRVEKAPAGEEVGNVLHMDAEDVLVTVEKLFLEDDEPVILTINQVPEHLMPGSVPDEQWQAPIFEFLLEHCRQRLSYYLSEIVPVSASSDLADLLHVEAGKALISFAEVGFNDENVPILKTMSYFRDDLLRLRLIRRQV
ncbi:MAG TPA: GntR family transcriptional regulator [Candidatus Sulfomarinibacteraceae bacterium]|nr:GntR family transcriptional regulator [Candidatus Sulfomarinibacteraceae bacterium]